MGIFIKCRTAFWFVRLRGIRSAIYLLHMFSQTAKAWSSLVKLSFQNRKVRQYWDSSNQMEENWNQCNYWTFLYPLSRYPYFGKNFVFWKLKQMTSNLDSYLARCLHPELCMHTVCLFWSDSYQGNATNINPSLRFLLLSIGRALTRAVPVLLLFPEVINRTIRQSNLSNLIEHNRTD